MGPIRPLQTSNLPFPRAQQVGTLPMQAGAMPATVATQLDISSLMNMMITMMIVVMMMKMMTGMMAAAS